MFCNKATRTAARLLESKKSKLFDDIIDIMWDPKNAENTVQFHNKCMNCLEDVGNKDKAFYKDLNDCKKDK
jgi:arsenate reductase-like glutaredoxin family protein